MRDMAERKAETKWLSPESVPNNINKYLYNVVNVGTYACVKIHTVYIGGTS